MSKILSCCHRVEIGDSFISLPICTRSVLVSHTHIYSLLPDTSLHLCECCSGARGMAGPGEMHVRQSTAAALTRAAPILLFS